MVVNNEINKLLIDLGLTAYEARAYLALLLRQPATAYEIAKESGIPTSKVYETVSRLLEKGIIQTISEGHGRGQQYGALNAEDFVNAKQEETLQKAERLGNLLKTLGNSGDSNLIWRLNSEDGIYNKAKQLIRQAKDHLLISLWRDELIVLDESLEAALERGVKIALVHFGIPEKKIGATFHHPVEKTLHQEKGGRGLTLVTDSRLVLMATFFDQGGIEGAWSRNHTFVTVAEDYVKHDVYITKVTSIMGEDLKRIFGEEYQELRDVFKPVDKPSD
ncbi:MAG: TrmB family transcriptional regulator [SAR324 cluster bacterium]|nr:TrmB family transcriptional regulator [SAR324 cluster bacterium]